MSGLVSNEEKYDTEATADDNIVSDFKYKWREQLLHRTRSNKTPQVRQLNYERNEQYSKTILNQYTNSIQPAKRRVENNKHFWKTWLIMDTEIYDLES